MGKKKKKRCNILLISVERVVKFHGQIRVSDGQNRASQGLSTADDDDPFIVLTETKFSICYIPVWARYSPLRTRVKAHAITLSP
jgi:hypothetical protein